MMIAKFLLIFELAQIVFGQQYPFQPIQRTCPTVLTNRDACRQNRCLVDSNCNFGYKCCKSYCGTVCQLACTVSVCTCPFGTTINYAVDISGCRVCQCVALNNNYNPNNGILYNACSSVRCPWGFRCFIDPITNNPLCRRRHHQNDGGGEYYNNNNYYNNNYNNNDNDGFNDGDNDDREETLDCKNVKCPNGYNCELDRQTNSAICTKVSGCPPIDQCVCQYNIQWVTQNGCSNCTCQDPCSKVRCDQSSTCVRVYRSCDANQSRDCTPRYEASCQRSSSCAKLVCRGCRYGYELDQNGCQTCTCKNA